ncbi:MAG: hypothetical protein AAGM22_01960 [Acidobacteriota bacterium]
MSELRLESAFATLVRHRVDFVVVGGVAGVLYGAPFTTQDLDLVYSRAPENVARLARAMAELEARYVDPAGRHIVPDEAKLAALRVHLLETTCGRLDLLTTIPPNLPYERLIAEATSLTLGEIDISVVNLGVLIESKEKLGRPKDRYQVLYLREIEAQRTRGSIGDGQGR